MIKLPDDVVYALARLKSTIAQCNRLNYCAGALHELEQAIRLNAAAQPFRENPDSTTKSFRDIEETTTIAQPVSDEHARIAEALESLLWPNMAIGNKAIILCAIKALRGIPAAPGGQDD